MKTRVSILFLFRKKSRLTEPEKLPTTPGTVYCRLTVRGATAVFTTGIATTYGDWDAGAGRLRGRSEAAKTANEQLVKLRDRLTDLAADFDRQGKPVTAKRLLSRYQTNGCGLSLLGLFEQFLAEQTRLVGLEISPATLVQHQSRRSNLRAFLAAQGLTDLRPEEFTHNMADRLLHWLMGHKGHARNTALKNLQNVSQVLTWGVRRDLLEQNPMELYRYKLAAPKPLLYLTELELEVLTDNGMPVACLERVRDCFVFQCWTGLAYADLAALNVARDTEAGAHGRQVLRVIRQKSTLQKGYECVIPLLPEAERLLHKYQGRLPVPSNQVYNRYLKQVGELCGIAPEKMTSHVGRKTAGVLMLNRGIRMEVVSKFLGHSSVTMTEKVYAKILDTTLVNEFDRVFGPATPRPAPAPLRALPEAPATWAEWDVPAPAPSARPAEVRRPARRFVPALTTSQLVKAVP
ncbi:site-specific integrase [Hymenobacter arizonensis]|uniref:Site-specific recombinase XerD n=1 Tax=Hymenobacter arizonensis TaxID=1227077 RepID=A0A1I5T7L7_HYMAR|nr:site-specific integrase [Hymenobacter arizonensis]SFP79030.1 Site-specific recombinase XerD [Hymenobacter arizonensis]